jgi:hypothetical protein
MFVFQLNTHTIGSGTLIPFPPSVSVPVTVNDELGVGLDGVAEAVSIVELGLVSEPVWRFSVIVPGPVKETGVRSPDPAQDRPPEQTQLETE